MQELKPLLVPAKGEITQPAALHRYKQYLGLITDALKAVQAQAASAPALRTPAKAEQESFQWTALSPALAAMLTLAFKLAQQVPVADCSQVW